MIIVGGRGNPSSNGVTASPLTDPKEDEPARQQVMESIQLSNLK